MTQTSSDDTTCSLGWPSGGPVFLHVLAIEGVTRRLPTVGPARTAQRMELLDEPLIPDLAMAMAACCP